MPRSGDEYALPAGTAAVSGTTANSTHANARFDDLAEEQNLVRPISKGGTGASSAGAARAALGLEIGVNVQAYDADLLSWAGVARASGFDTFAATPSSANLRALLTDEVGTGAAYFVGGALGTPASGVLTNCTGLTTAGIEAATLVVASEGIASNDNDTTIPTSAAVKAYADSVAPVSPVKAWGNLAANIGGSGTYSRTGNTITVSMTGHGMTTGQGAQLDFTTGTATDAYYIVTVVDANTFTVTDPVSGSTSGSVQRLTLLRGGLGVSVAARIATGIYEITLSPAMPDANYAVIVSGNQTGDDSAGDLNDWYTARIISSSSFRIRAYDQGSVAANPNAFYFAVLR